MFKQSALANIIFLCAPIVVGLVMAFLLPQAMGNPKGFSVAALAFYVVGFVFFAAAKIQNIRRGYLVSFGAAQMSPLQRQAYRIGYVLMGIGLLTTVTLAVATNLTTR